MVHYVISFVYKRFNNIKELRLDSVSLCVSFLKWHLFVNIELLCSLKGTYRTPASYLSVRVGSQDLGKGGEVFKVATVINHPSFNTYSFDFDFALLKLSSLIKLDGKTKAIIPLPTGNQAIADNTAVSITGWGETQNSKESNKVLRSVIVPTINQAKCDNIYYFDGGVTSRMVCAGSAGKDSCTVSFHLFSVLLLIYFYFYYTGRFRWDKLCNYIIIRILLTPNRWPHETTIWRSFNRYCFFWNRLCWCVLSWCLFSCCVCTALDQNKRWRLMAAINAENF